MTPAGRLREAVVAAVLAVLAAVALAGCGRSGPPLPTASAAQGVLPAGVDVAVTRVVDGDTLVVTGGERVRLIGMDTPETVAPNRPVGCYGKEASAFTASLLPPGTGVRLVGDAEERDVYGRLLAYVYRRSDALFVNAELVRRGYAQPLTIPPNVAHADELAALARQARESSQGLWGACQLLPDGKVAPAASSAH